MDSLPLHDVSHVHTFCGQIDTWVLGIKTTSDSRIKFAENKFNQNAVFVIQNIEFIGSIPYKYELLLLRRSIHLIWFHFFVIFHVALSLHIEHKWHIFA